ncbi:MAG: hypothetical protein FJW77_03100 [Actinobacteria bacterium]|nr:hypothetical protein [Actinomycetota bacterium]
MRDGPHRASTQLRTGLDVDAEQAVALAAAAVLAYLADLDARLGTVDTLLDDARGLVHLAAASAGDTAPDLVASELSEVARALAAAAPTATGDDPVATDHRAAVTIALRGLDHAFADVRHRLGTVGHSTEELARLLSVMRRVHGIGTALTEGGPPPTG